MCSVDTWPIIDEIGQIAMLLDHRLWKRFHASEHRI